MSYYLMGLKFLFCKMKSSGALLHNSVKMLTTIELHIYNGEDGKFYVVFFNHNLKGFKFKNNVEKLLIKTSTLI